MRYWRVKDVSPATIFLATRLFSRCVSSKLFIGDLSYDTNETALRDAFCEHGEIIEVKVICDRSTSKSKGYGFVQFSCEKEATTALEKMNGEFLDGRSIRVKYANKG
ncbi:glycine-rich RNA-binding protein 2, mitochondrial isoform X2 [Canna indica]|uniref:Glycine-rich RNA-binding protein 2, mitochondrial isoform X2 n=1 Tax=Canna indica TaxID=4628 RepID=A0AAQ3QHB4_9LILI|nr:glycine-rich RNA-binding protein 2, mitochondrial isoform X2 [Canna indica]